MFQIRMSSHDEGPTYQGLPALLIGRAGRRLLRQQEILRRPGEEADQGSSAPVESVGRILRKGRGFRPRRLEPSSPPSRSPPCPLQPSPPPTRGATPSPTRRAITAPGHQQLACEGLPPPARIEQMVCLPLHHAGSSRPGCWNCGRFGHSWVNGTLPRLRFCRMCGRLGCTIATCPSCCDEWGRRRLRELDEEKVQLEELPPNESSEKLFFVLYVFFIRISCL